MKRFMIVLCLIGWLIYLKSEAQIGPFLFKPIISVVDFNFSGKFINFQDGNTKRHYYLPISSVILIAENKDKKAEKE